MPYPYNVQHPMDRGGDIIVPDEQSRRDITAYGIRIPPEGITRQTLPLVLIVVALAVLAVLTIAQRFSKPLDALAELLERFIIEEAALLHAMLTILVILAPFAAWMLIREHARRLRLRADKDAVISMPHGHPVHVDQLTRGELNRYLPITLAEYHATQRQWAQHSTFRNLHTYTVSNRQDYRAPALPASPAIPETPALTTAPQFSTVSLDLGDGLLVGEDAGGQAHRIDLSVCSAIGIGGQPRVGKTTTTKLLLAQIVGQGGYLALCDPHGKHDQGLLKQCYPISGACIRQAIEPDEITEAILFVDKIGSQRKRQGQGGAPVVLVVDEFTSLVMRQLLPDDILMRLTAMTVEYAKFNLHLILIAHDWSKAALGTLGTPLRRAITHRIVHRSDIQNAEFLLPNAALARQVPLLAKGQALYWSDAAPVTLAVPFIDDQVLHAAARGQPPKAYQPGEKVFLLQPAAPGPVPASVMQPDPPPRPSTNADRIVDFLAGQDQPVDVRTIAAATGIDQMTVSNTVRELTNAGQLARFGSPRNYTYAVKRET